MSTERVKGVNYGEDLQLDDKFVEQCKLRANLRNGMRSYVERSNLWSRLTGVSYIKPVTVEDLIEENARRVEAIYEIQEVDMIRAEKEEKMKLQIQRLKENLARGKYDMNKFTQSFVDEMQFNELDEVNYLSAVAYTIRAYLKQLVNEGRSKTFLDAYLSLYTTDQYCPKFPSMALDVRNNHLFQQRLRLVLADINTSKGPLCYAAVKKFLAEEGFIEIKELDFSSEIGASVKFAYFQAVSKGPIFFKSLTEEFDYAYEGYGFDERSIEALKEMIIVECAAAMEEYGIGFYEYVRNLWVNTNVIDAEEIDDAEDVREAMYVFLEKYAKKNPAIFKKLMNQFFLKGYQPVQIDKLNKICADKIERDGIQNAFLILDEDEEYLEKIDETAIKACNEYYGRAVFESNRMRATTDSFFDKYRILGFYLS